MLGAGLPRRAASSADIVGATRPYSDDYGREGMLYKMKYYYQPYEQPYT